VESALVYQNTANFELAIHSYEQAREEWRRELNVELLRPEIELFFEMSLGSVYESAGKDLIALTAYVRALRGNMSKHNKLAYNHPDEAFPYCGLGSVFYHMDEPAWALRCYLKARTIREDRLGGDTVDTATVYNNLGCCMFMLERNQEALAYFELSNAILECELGSHHERTLTSQRNIHKAKRTVLGITPEFRQLW
jgi:tetratricopeptide (TPR) repeat protein